MNYKEEMILARQLAKQAKDKVNKDGGKSRKADPYADLYGCMTVGKTRISNLQAGYVHRYSK